MYISFAKNEKSVIKTYELSDKELEILNFIVQNEGINFKGLKYGEHNPFDKTNTFQYNECSDLIVHGFIDEDSDALNTYTLTAFGKYFVEK